MLIDGNRRLKLEELEEKLGHKFEDIRFLNSAFIHTSYTNENLSLRGKSNERLEFLGDAVLETVVSEILYKSFPHNDEGFLTKLRANLVCEASFSSFFDSIEANDLLLLGRGEEKTGGRDKDSLKADAFEAINGALYIDGGYDKVYAFIYDLIKDLISDKDNLIEKVNDYKSMLQEHLHKYKNINCHYRLVKEVGPPHSKEFFMDVYQGKKKIGSGQGKSKKIAEQMAAKDALEKLAVI